MTNYVIIGVAGVFLALITAPIKRSLRSYISHPWLLTATTLLIAIILTIALACLLHAIFL